MDACLVVPAGLVVGSDGKLGKCMVGLLEISNVSIWLGDGQKQPPEVFCKKICS